MTYRAPIGDMRAALRWAGFDAALDDGRLGDLTGEDVGAVLEEAGRFAGDVIAPLNRIGDKHGAVLENGRVTTAPGWKEAYSAWAAAGWNALAAPEAHGGQGLPIALNAATIEMWNAAALAFGLGPLLTVGAIEALNLHASEDLKRTYLDKIVAGNWMGTMNLTEPQAGSDLSGVRTKAERAGDGTYRIRGEKIYITYGEHDLTDNIVHMVLARLTDAPAGTRGISLFLVPKFLVKEDGTLGERNDLRCAALEHKLGIHGSPTCSMVFGENDGAVGWLVGEENRGLACMFTMMNNARLNVGLQGVAIAERAVQQAHAFASERRQGKAPGDAGGGMSAIAAHPDVKRMLLTMRALTQGARAICYRTAVALDLSHRGEGDAARKAAEARAALLTPIAKAFGTDAGIEVASLGVQVHGGMGYIEETGAAQHLRDVRITAIYEGTNGIQAIDLVTRKLSLAGGAVVRAEIAAGRAAVARTVAASPAALGDAGARLRTALDSLDRATSFLIEALAAGDQAKALAGATPYLELFGTVLSGAALIEMALDAADTGAADAGERAALARFFGANRLPRAAALEVAVLDGHAFAEAAA